MIRALSGVRSDDAYGCMVLLEHKRPSIGHMPATVWCPNTATRRVSVSHDTRGTISTRVCDAHEQGLVAEGRLLESTDLGVVMSILHPDCDNAGKQVTCDRCGDQYICTPQSDYYCTPEGDHCCERCLVGNLKLITIPGGAA